MRADIAIERSGELHEAIKNYSRTHNVNHARAYAELLAYGVYHIEDCLADDEVGSDGVPVRSR